MTVGNADSEVSCGCLTEQMTDEQRKKVVPRSGEPPNLLEIPLKDLLPADAAIFVTLFSRIAGLLDLPLLSIARSIALISSFSFLIFSAMVADCIRKHSQYAIASYHPLLVVGPSCTLRLFPCALTDSIAQVRNFSGDVSPRLFATSWCDQQAETYAYANSEQQHADPAEYVGIFLATKCVRGTANSLRRGAIRVPDPVRYVVHIV
jgi:hypothetical protein